MRVKRLAAAAVAALTAMSLLAACSGESPNSNNNRSGSTTVLKVGMPNGPQTENHNPFLGSSSGASLGYRWSDDFRWVVGPFQGEVPSYGVVDAAANFDVNAHFAIGLNVQNLLDDEHWESFGGDLLGRRALGSLTFRW